MATAAPSPDAAPVNPAAAAALARLAPAPDSPLARGSPPNGAACPGNPPQMRALVRDEPDPEAINGRRELWSLLLLVATAIIALPTLPYFALVYVLTRPKGFNGLLGYVTCQAVRFALRFDMMMPPRETPEKRARVVQPLTLSFRGTEQVAVTTFTLPPAPAPWTAALEPKVAPISLPAYVLSPPGAPCGEAPAAKGEKALLYLHGG